MKKLKYKIYSLNCPLSKEIRYIGVTTISLKRRLTQHIYEGKHKSGSHKINWIKSLLNQNLWPSINLVEVVTEDTWQDKEKYWIKFHNKNQRLTNTHIGGSHVYIGPKSNKSKCKKVYQYDLTGKYLKEYKSQTEAAKAVNVSASSLNRVLSGARGGSSGGFQWSLVKFKSMSSYFKETGTKIKVYKMVPQLVENCISITETTKKYNISYNGIIAALEDKRPCKGYLFERDKDIV